MGELLCATAAMVPAIEPTARAPFTWISVAELMRRGMLTLQYQTPVRPGEPSEVPDGQIILTLDAVMRDVSPAELSPSDVQRNIVVRPGDVIVPQLMHLTQRPVVRVIQEGGPVLGLRLSLLRVDPDRLDPYFVAGFLGSSANLRNTVTSTMGSRPQADVRRAELPLLALDEQRAYGETFRRLAGFTSALREAAAAGEDMLRLLTDSLTLGNVQPALPGPRDGAGVRLPESLPHRD